VLLLKWPTLLKEEEVLEEDAEEDAEVTVKAVAEEAVAEVVEEEEAIRVTRMSGFLSPSSAAL